MMMMLLLLLATVCVCLIGKLIWNRIVAYKLRSNMGLSGPAISFMSGNLSDLQVLKGRTNNRTHREMQKWFLKYGRNFGIYVGPKLNVLCTDLDIMREVLIKNTACFTDRSHDTLQSEAPVSDSILGQRGNEWKHSRNLVTPAFSGKKMKEMSKIIEEKTATMVEIFEEVAKEGKAFNIYDNYQGLTLDVIGRCAFALDTDCQKDFSDPFYINCRGFFQTNNFFGSFFNILAMMVPELGPVYRFVQYRKRFAPLAKAEQWLVNSLYQVVNARKQNAKDFSESTDILQLLLKEKKSAADPATLEVSLDRDKDSAKSSENGSDQVQNGASNKDSQGTKLSTEQVIGNCYAFLLAGYETTSTALATTSWLLARHQHVQHKLVQEIDAVLGQKNIATYDDVKSMPYMNAVFKESLRFYPPVNSFCARTCVEECWVGGMKFIPETLITFPIWQIHHDPTIWQDPDTFDPERFVTGQIPSHPMAWIPFGGGPRNCVGMRFADMEFKIALASLLKKFTIHFEDENQPDLEQEENNVLNRPGKVEVLLKIRS